VRPILARLHVKSLSASSHGYVGLGGWPDRTGANANDRGFWNDATPDTFPHWVQIHSNGAKSTDRAVCTIQESHTNPVEPTDTMTFFIYCV